MSSKQRILVMLLAAGLVAGCDVIKPELLGESIGVARDAAVDGAAIDAYQPELGNLIANPDFEAQGTSGWTTNGGNGTITLATAGARTGVYGLRVAMRSGVWNGPAVVLTAKVRRGKHYVARAWARLAGPGTDSFAVAIRHTCSEDGQHFNQQTTRQVVTAPDNATWVQPSSSFIVVNSPTCTLAEVLMYVETSATVAPFYVDDVDLVEVVP